MARVQVQADDIDLDDPILVEGLPGAGLVGKIAADYLVDSYDMQYYGAVHCEGLPPVAVYRGEGSDVRPPVRLYADERRDLLVLQSDVPVSPSSASAFASCVTSWLDDNDVLPLYLSGLPREKDGSPELYGVATGEAEHFLDDTGIVPPREDGMITGPTGALLYRAAETDLDALGIIVEADAKFPDPEAARAILAHAVCPLAEIEIDTEKLVQQADEIQEARERLARQLREADDESTEAQPLRMFQ